MKIKAKKSKAILMICNILLILAMITAAWLYSGHISKSQEEIKTTDFIRTIESMKTVSQNYLNGEKGYIEDWASYIFENDMDNKKRLIPMYNIKTRIQKNCLLEQSWRACLPEMEMTLKFSENTVCRKHRQWLSELGQG